MPRTPEALAQGLLTCQFYSIILHVLRLNRHYCAVYGVGVAKAQIIFKFGQGIVQHSTIQSLGLGQKIP